MNLLIKNIMKTYIIASTEYRANMPDLFLMDENGNYYGVSETSYAKWDKFPTNIHHWENREGSDEGRRFNIDCVELTDEQVREFDELTKEYARLDAEKPNFNEPYPIAADFKTKKAYTQACDAWVDRYQAWVKEANIAYYVTRKREIWDARTDLFATFSTKVYNAIKYHECFRR